MNKRSPLLLAAAVIVLSQAPSWAKSGVITGVDLPTRGSITLIPVTGPVTRMVADPSIPVQSVLPAAFVTTTIPAPAASAAPAAQSQIQALGNGISAAQRGDQSPKESLDQAFERSVAEAKGESAPVAAPQSQPSGSSLSSYEKEYHPAPQPPAPNDPKDSWRKRAPSIINGGVLGALVLGASTYILGLKSLEIPAFVGLLTGLLPYLRSMKADGKAGDFLPVYVQSILGGGLGLFFGWGMSHFGYSTIMAGYSVMAGVFVPHFISDARKPTPDLLPIGQMLLSAFAGTVVGATLPIWLGGMLGDKIAKRKLAAK